MKTKILHSTAVSLLITITAVLVSVPGWSQDANALLNEVSNKVRAYDNIEIEFKYNLENSKEKVSQEARGNVTLEGDKYVLNMLGTTTLFDGSKTYTIVPEDEEVTIAKADPSDEKTITPSRMLTFYENGYRSSMDITQNVRGRKIQFVKLVPIDTNAEIKDILLGIDQQTKHIYKLIQTDDNGTRYTLTVNSFKTDQQLSSTLFTFDEAKYEDLGYYINKLN